MAVSRYRHERCIANHCSREVLDTSENQQPIPSGKSEEQGSLESLSSTMTPETAHCSECSEDHSYQDAADPAHAVLDFLLNRLHLCNHRGQNVPFPPVTKPRTECTPGAARTASHECPSTVVFPQRGACSTSFDEITPEAKSSFSHSAERVVLVFMKLDWPKNRAFPTARSMCDTWFLICSSTGQGLSIPADSGAFKPLCLKGEMDSV